MSEDINNELVDDLGIASIEALDRDIDHKRFKKSLKTANC